MHHANERCTFRILYNMYFAYILCKDEVWAHLQALKELEGPLPYLLLPEVLVLMHLIHLVQILHFLKLSLIHI